MNLLYKISVDNKLTSLLLLLMFNLSLFSCSDNDDVNNEELAPIVTELTMFKTTKTVVEKACIVFSVQAQGGNLLDHFTVEVHPADGGENVFEKTFSDNFNGLKNKDVHVHGALDLSDVEPGNYHFHLTIYDNAGNEVSVEEDIIIEKSSNNQGAIITELTMFATDNIVNGKKCVVFYVKDISILKQAHIEVFPEEGGEAVFDKIFTPEDNAGTELNEFHAHGGLDLSTVSPGEYDFHMTVQTTTNITEKVEKCIVVAKKEENQEE